MIGRRLRREEMELWAHVVAGVQPLAPRARASRIADASEALEAKPAPKSNQPKGALAEKAVAPVRSPQTPREGFDFRTLKHLRRGRMEIEARLDLHGYRAAEAHRALTAFLRRAQADGARLALVVTGKGRSEGYSSDGVLRRHTPMWLTDRALADVVSGFSQANATHGGEGALYVRLRRRDRGS